MAYGYFCTGTHERPAVFDLFFRKCPFKGEYTVFAGLKEAISFIQTWGFTSDQLAYIQKTLSCSNEFIEWLRHASTNSIKVYALNEGSFCFPSVPLLRLEGPLAIVQLLETTLLCLVNYPTLVCTNALRHVIAAEAINMDGTPTGKTVIEFGLRRAQGPDGAMSASRYTYMGGVNGTSNVLAGFMYGCDISGTMAHAFIQSFTDEATLPDTSFIDANGVKHPNFIQECFDCRQELGFTSTNKGELISYAAYARVFPRTFLALVDTYDTIKSGVPNFLSVSLALHRAGYRARGIRLDSGDLADLSNKARALFTKVGTIVNIDYFSTFTIVASNDINEHKLLELKKSGHSLDCFGIGTNLVTCEAQPALGAVFKLVDISGEARVKLSEDVGKMSLPGNKTGYRFFGDDGSPLCDYMTLTPEPAPIAGQPCNLMLPYNPDPAQKPVVITPAKVVTLHHLVWDHGTVVDQSIKRDIAEIRQSVLTQAAGFNAIRTTSPTDPAKYQVYVSVALHTSLHTLAKRARGEL
ncbi:nicotinate phosphoribosyltransferase [Pelomyxa schiedti]|nr:nicotinate phosphoribosyltransferase [Pelomyxa schiedti]